MMGSKRRGAGVAQSAREYDIVTGWRHVLCFTQRAGACSGVKKGMRRRERHDVRQKLRGGQYE